MKNILKVCLVLVLCACVLLVAGCKKKADKNLTPGGTQPATTAPQGSENPGTTAPNAAEPTVPTASQNPEGDPFDGTEPTGPVIGIDTPVATDPASGGNTDGGNTDGGNTDGGNTGSDVEVTEEPTDDFDVDFGELMG